jgi:hypothetical protein
MDIRVKTTRVSLMSDQDIRQLVDYLTKEGSEFHSRIVRGDFPYDPISIIKEINGRFVAWASVREWKEFKTIEAFTLPSVRRQGLSVEAIKAVTNTPVFESDKPIAIFSPSLIGACIQSGLKELFLFKEGKNNDDWPFVAKILAEPSGGTSSAAGR